MTGDSERTGLERRMQSGVDSGVAALGDAIGRREDARLLTGETQYTDDIEVDDAAYVAVLRGQYAHARIEGIDTSEAEAHEHVIGVYTAEDVYSDVPGEYIVRSVPDDLEVTMPERPLLAREKIRYQGEPVAVVVAEERYVAHDACDLIDVTYDPLPAVTDPTSMTDPTESDHTDESEPVHADPLDNVAFEWSTGKKEETDRAFEDADHVVSVDLSNQRLVPVPIEPRALTAEYRDGELTVQMSTQTPHHHRTFLATALGLRESDIRVRAPAVGGGFGSKDHFYAVEAVACWCAMRTGRPIRWQSTRTETFQTDSHGRGHETSAELAFDADGTLTGLRADTYASLGAYVSTSAPTVTTSSYGKMLAGAYTIPAVHCTVTGVYTNEAPTGAYRGAGRPEATFVVERLLSLAAAELGVDPAELRRQNFVPPDAFPYESPTGYVYDSGQYENALDLALETIGYDELRERQADLRTQGRYLGIGLSSFVEVAGYGPVPGNPEGPIPPLYESGLVRFHPSGEVTAYCGTADQGQGHQTVYAQLLSEKLGVPYDDIEVVEGDSEAVAYGTGTFGSRSAALGGGALATSADRVLEKARRIAAQSLEVSVEDVEFEDGEFRVTGAPEFSITIQSVARNAYLARGLPDDVEPGLEASAVFAPEDFNFPFGTHVCALEIDSVSGDIDILRYVAVDDCGNQLNPTIVEGQIHGGIAQGIGQALLEEAVYDSGGSLVTGSLQDYAVPRATDIPELETGHTVTPTPHNPLGAKGVGESGTIAAPPAVVNAVVDALRQIDGVTVDHVDMPVTPEEVWRAIHS